MSESNRELLTIGVVIITIIVASLLYVANLINWTLIVPVILLPSGLWLIILGAIRMGNPVKYERTPFSTAALGLLAIALGVAWIVFSINWLYSIIVILLVAAGLAIITALKRK